MRGSTSSSSGRGASSAARPRLPPGSMAAPARRCPLRSGCRSAATSAWPRLRGNPSLPAAPPRPFVPGEGREKDISQFFPLFLCPLFYVIFLLSFLPAPPGTAGPRTSTARSRDERFEVLGKPTTPRTAPFAPFFYFSPLSAGSAGELAGKKRQEKLCASNKRQPDSYGVAAEQETVVPTGCCRTGILTARPCVSRTKQPLAEALGPSSSSSSFPQARLGSLLGEMPF